MQPKKKKWGLDLQSLINGESGMKNKAHLSKMGLELLAKDFESNGLESHAERIMRYALDGEGDEILQELEMLDVYFKAKHFAPLLRSKVSREKLFEESPSGAHEFLERLGKIYHALMNPLNPNFVMPTRFQSPSWLEALLLHAAGSYSGDMRAYLQLKIIESFMIASGKSEAALVGTVFLTETLDYSACEIISIFFSLIDLPELVAANKEIVEEALQSEDERIAVRALNGIQSFGIEKGPFRKAIAQHAMGDSVSKRKVAQRIIKKDPDGFLSTLKEILVDTSPEHKLRGIRFFGRLYGNTERVYLTSILEAESSERMKKAILHILETQDEA